MIPSQKQLAASICVQFGEHYLAEKECDQAVRSYKEALSYSPTDNQVGPHPPVCAPPPRSSGVGHGTPGVRSLLSPTPGPPSPKPLEQGREAPLCTAICGGRSREDAAKSHVREASSGPPWRWGDRERVAARGSLA